MAPNLKPEVVAAIETAVEVNEGKLESAFIHALAKIYKTSPQAVVWNMKRYNKVKAGMDDRKKNGRHAVMDKEQAATFMRELEARNPGMKYDKISDALFEKFGVRVSTTWVLRLIKNHDIPNKRPPVASPRKKRVRKEAKRKETNTEPESRQVDLTNAYISDPEHYPSFRQDLQEAIVGNSVSSVENCADSLPSMQLYMPPNPVYHHPHIAEQQHQQQPQQPQQPQPQPQQQQATERPPVLSGLTERSTSAPMTETRRLPPPTPSPLGPTFPVSLPPSSRPPERDYVWKVVNVVELP